MFNEFPYTNYEKINLDWLLDLGKKLKEDAESGAFDGDRGPGIFGITTIYAGGEVGGPGYYCGKIGDAGVGDFVIGYGPAAGNNNLYLMKVTSVSGNYLEGTTLLQITGPQGAQGPQGEPGEGGLTEAMKQALLQMARKVAYIDDGGQTYYTDLYNAFYPPANLVSISAVFSQGNNVIYDTDELSVLRQYLTVTANYDDSTSADVTSYTLSGTLTAGTSAITVSYGGKTTTFNVIVTHAITMYTIQNNLTNVINSNPATSIAENAQYSATLTPSTNYRFSTVNVTMGAVDITSTVYGNGVITIASVTGNIVNTAVAVEDTPVSGPDAWYDGVSYAFREGTTPDTYIPSNNGIETAYAGWSSSDYMNCEGATSLTYQFHTPWGAWYDANKNYISSCSLTVTTSESVKTIAVPSNAAYFRTSWADEGTASPYVIQDSWYITPNA